MTLQELEIIRFAWAKETFPDATPISALNHLRTELDEIQENIVNGVKNPEEYADAFMLLCDTASRDGVTISSILEAWEKKHQKNLNRQWVKQPDGSYYHVK